MLYGVEKTVIAVIGHRPPELLQQIQRMPGVETAMPVGAPYKLAAQREGQERTSISVGGATIGDGSVAVMAGPCTVESREQLLTTARHVTAQGAHILRGGAFKPRSSPYSFQGMGAEGLRLLEEAKALTGLPVITEILDPRQVEEVAGIADILQIGTRNAQNYPLLNEVGRLETPVLLKRGMGNTIEEWIMCAEYILAAGNPNVLLCERGIRTFETESRFTLDLNAVPLLRRATHLPVVVDPSQGTGKWHMVGGQFMLDAAVRGFEYRLDQPIAGTKRRVALTLPALGAGVEFRMANALEGALPQLRNIGEGLRGRAVCDDGRANVSCRRELDRD